MPPATAAGDMDEAKAAIVASLTSKHVPPTQRWLEGFMPSVRLNTPVVALQKTALFRLLATDLTVGVQAAPQACLPVGISDPAQQELRIQGPIPVQVLDIEDIGRSRWSQVEAIEMDERGETTKGREIIRVVPDADDNTDPNPPANAISGNASTGPHKLLVQDARGTKAYAFELTSVKGINNSMAIGSKLVLTSFTVARGVILLEPNCVEMLGGKVDVWDQKWREGRKKVLKGKAGWTEGTS